MLCDWVFVDSLACLLNTDAATADLLNHDHMNIMSCTCASLQVLQIDSFCRMAVVASNAKHTSITGYLLPCALVLKSKYCRCFNFRYFNRQPCSCKPSDCLLYLQRLKLAHL